MKIIKSLLFVFTLIIMGTLTACNTVHGAGQDIQAGGRAISNAAS